jgi:hypothetical protein
VKVQGVGSDGATLFERQLDGWYVLAGTHRAYELAIPPEVCPGLKSISISAQTDSHAATAAIATANIGVTATNCR